MYLSVDVHVHAHLHVYTHICKYTYVYIYIYIAYCVCEGVCVCVFIQMDYANMYVHAWALCALLPIASSCNMSAICTCLQVPAFMGCVACRFSLPICLQLDGMCKIVTTPLGPLRSLQPRAHSTDTFLIQCLHGSSNGYVSTVGLDYFSKATCGACV